MRKIFGILALVTVFTFSLHASAQSSKAATKRIPKKTSSSRQREIPTIKCDDPDSMTACKSFRQLVEAKDKDVLEAIVGKKSFFEDKHIAYVCFAPRIGELQVDRFRIIYFDQPSTQHFFKHPKPSQDSPYGGFYSMVPFLNASHAPESIEVLTTWFEDYSDFYLYSPGQVDELSYQNGVLSNLEFDSGNWSRALDSTNLSSTFEGAHYWLADYDSKNNDRFSKYDEAKSAHIAVGGSMIDVFYDFENASEETTHYRLEIQRSTGRFTQSFSTGGIQAPQESGTCNIFK